ncbi:hypothetical protein ACLB2K_013644 [Fragaria x ananassa]
MSSIEGQVGSGCKGVKMTGFKSSSHYHRFVANKFEGESGVVRLRREINGKNSSNSQQAAPIVVRSNIARGKTSDQNRELSEATVPPPTSTVFSSHLGNS